MVSMPELERLLPTVDKSTISRALTLFLAHGLIHAVDDGSGTMKYNVCDDDCDCEELIEDVNCPTGSSCQVSTTF